MKQPNFKTATFKEVLSFLVEQSEKVFTYQDVELTARPATGEDSNDLINISVNGFAFTWGGWYSDTRRGESIYSTDLTVGNAAMLTAAAEKLADIFGIEMGKTASDTPKTEQDDVIKSDERDIEIAGLKAQLEVYQRFMPAPSTVSYKNEASYGREPLKD